MWLYSRKKFRGGGADSTPKMFDVYQYSAIAHDHSDRRGITIVIFCVDLQ